MALEKKIDFVALVSVLNANPNGDPLNGNRPRTDYDDYGEISDVCIKRKIRNRMQDLGYDIFVQSRDNTKDGFSALRVRAESIGLEKNDDDYVKKACKKWIDVRSFGQVFAFKNGQTGEEAEAMHSQKNKNKEDKKEKGVSIGVRGPVSIQICSSLDPIEVISMQITKSANNEEKKVGEKSSDTMGTKHFIKYGLYEIKGSINVQLAEKTGFSYEDAEILKNCLKTLFINDSSAARPSGSMIVNKLYWFEHNNKDGQYSSYKVHNSVKIRKRDGIISPKNFEDYLIELETLPNLKSIVIDGE